MRISDWSSDVCSSDLMVACNGDLMHSYRDLLGGHPRGAKVAKGLARKRWSPSLFVVHFGVKGEYPDIAHHSILFGRRHHGFVAILALRIDRKSTRLNSSH